MSTSVQESFEEVLEKVNQKWQHGAIKDGPFYPTYHLEKTYSRHNRHPLGESKEISSGIHITGGRSIGFQNHTFDLATREAHWPRERIGGLHKGDQSSYRMRAPANSGKEGTDWIYLQGVKRGSAYLDGYLRNERFAPAYNFAPSQNTPIDFDDVSSTHIGGIDFIGANFKGADLSGLNFRERSFRIFSRGKPHLEFEDMHPNKYNGEWLSIRKEFMQYRIDCEESANRSEISNLFQKYHPILDQNRLSDFSQEVMETVGNTTFDWQPSRRNLWTIRRFVNCMSSANYRWISDSEFLEIKSGNVIVDENTKLPPNWVESGGYLLGKTADLEDQDLRGITIEGVDLSRARLHNIQSQNLVGKPKKLPWRWNLFQIGGNNNKGVLIGPGANLQDTNLGDLDLSRLNWKNWRHIKSGNTKGDPILPPPPHPKWPGEYFHLLVKRNGFLLGL